MPPLYASHVPYLRAMVDMGSNGIRFSITDLYPSKARIFPTLYRERRAISLYDTQWENGVKRPIPQAIIDQVIEALISFKRIVEEFKVKEENFTLIATEATRTAENSNDFLDQILDHTGKSVELLSPQDETMFGGLGLLSCYESVAGWALDMGGGSVQLSWFVSSPVGLYDIDTDTIGNAPAGRRFYHGKSFPYGAAALAILLDEAFSSGTQAVQTLFKQLCTDFATIIHDESVPEVVRRGDRGDGKHTLRLTGGGFRGLGYRMMHHLTRSKEHPYPIPIIDRFAAHAPPPVNINSVDIDRYTWGTADAPKDKMFRVSRRRHAQAPAVNFLIDAVRHCLPSVTRYEFVQGGIVEGLYFSALASELRRQPPLEAATAEYASTSVAALHWFFSQAIRVRPSSSSVARGEHSHLFSPLHLDNPSLTRALVNLLHHFSHLQKESRAACALRCTTTGLLAGAHGISHAERAIIGLVLCARYGEELSPVDEGFLRAMQDVVGPREAWWARLAGYILMGIGELFPTGIVREEAEREILIDLHEEIRVKKGEDKRKKKGKKENYKVALRMDVVCSSYENTRKYPSWLKAIEKLGRKGDKVKAMQGPEGRGEDYFGCRIRVYLNGERNGFGDDDGPDDTQEGDDYEEYENDELDNFDGADDDENDADKDDEFHREDDSEDGGGIDLQTGQSSNGIDQQRTPSPHDSHVSPDDMDILSSPSTVK
ncbi:hypothetical protein MMC25_003766 [Agyrium rufum]|nr:hypothetical protein [Agyrium rufum]